MKRKRIWLIICIVALCVLSVYWINKAWAEDVNYEVDMPKDNTSKSKQAVWRYMLENSKGVRVYVDVKAVKTDITTNKTLSEQLKRQLKTDIELELRKYGIKVLTREDFSISKSTLPYSIRIGNPSLNLSLCLIEESLPDNYSYSFYLRHVEHATLLRKSQLSVASCWESELRLGRGPLPYMKKGVMDTVRIYINDYLAANPKQSSPSNEKKEAEKR